MITNAWPAQAPLDIFLQVGHSENVNSVSYSPDGRRIVSGSDDNTVKIWNAETGKLIRSLTGHSSSVRSVSFSPDGRRIVSGSSDKTVKIWDAETGKLIRSLTGHSSDVWSVSFSPDGRRIVSGSYDKTVKIWDAKTGNQLMTFYLLPGNEWLAWKPGKVFYNSSHQGDEWAALRFNNSNNDIYPLEYYRDTLKKDQWVKANDVLSPELKQKYFKRWWDELSTEKLYGLVGTSVITLLCLLFFLMLIRKKQTEPMYISKQFFEKAGFEKIEGFTHKKKKTHKNILKLHAMQGEMNAIASLWMDERISLLKQLTLDFSNQGQHKIKLYLIYTDKRPSTKDMQNLRSNHCEVIPIVARKLVKAIATDNPRETLIELEDPFIVRLDPYTESKPVHDPTWFYGRDVLMNRIPPSLAQGQHVGLFGLRKVGKTSLINLLKQRFASTPIVFISCQGIDLTAQSFFEDILRQLTNELKSLGQDNIPDYSGCKNSEDFKQQFLQLYELRKQSGHPHPFLMMLDEVDRLFPDRKLEQSAAILKEYIHIFSMLRGMAETNRCLVILVAAYRPHVNRHNQLSDAIGENPMFKSFTEEYLGFFNLEDSSKMIHEIGGWKDIQWEKKAAHRVFHYCAGHPLVTRYFASDASDQGSQKYVDLDKVEQTAATIIKTFRKNHIGNYFKESIFELLTLKEQECLFMICRGDNQELHESKIPEELESALTNIENFGIVNNVDGQLMISSELFKRWVMRRVKR
ncbi:hypothetical protein MHK_009379 [Candidatus Magnetomorum sp. HK-1]|nr:hypothetical protein MHK_009379 [Candidatus Magnetomorum sp. HK-1]